MGASNRVWGKTEGGGGRKEVKKGKEASQGLVTSLATPHRRSKRGTKVREKIFEERAEGMRMKGGKHSTLQGTSNF